MIKCRVTYKLNRKPIYKQGNHGADTGFERTNFSFQKEIFQVKLNTRMFDARYLCQMYCEMRNVKY